MKITEQNFITQIIRGNERALEYCMYHYGGLVRAVVCKCQALFYFVR